MLLFDFGDREPAATNWVSLPAHQMHESLAFLGELRGNRLAW